MKQSTFSAVMANSIKNLLQGYTKGIRFVAVLTVLLTMGIGQAWAEGTETFENLTSVSSYGSRSWTGVNGQTWSATLARTDQKISGNRGLTFSNANSSKTITMKLTDAQKAAGIGNFTFKYKHPYSDSGKTNTFSISVNGSNYSSGTLSYTSSTATKTITINAVPNSTSITITITGTARLCVDDFSWTSYVSANPYTVTLVPGSGSVTNTELEEASAGAGVELPEPTLDCGDWEFAGWKTTSAVTTETTTKPTLIAAGAYSPTSDITLYAVYQRTETTEGTPTTTDTTYIHTITAKTWSENGAQTLNNVSWTLSNDGSYYGYDGTKGQQVGSGSSPAKSMTLTTSGFASATKITAVRISTSGASSINGTVSVKVGSTAYTSGGNTTKSLTTTNTEYEFTGSSTGNIIISWSQTSSKAIYFKTIEVDYQTTTAGGGSTTYYHSTPDCGSTEPSQLATPTGLNVTNITSTSATLSWGEVANASSYVVTIVDGGAYSETFTTTSPSINITGLTAETDYLWTVQAIGDGTNYTDSGESETGEFTTIFLGYTITYETNGGDVIAATSGTALPNPLPTPTRQHYTFVGWYTDESCTQTATAGATIDADITLYAKWTPKVYLTILHPQDGVLLDTNGTQQDSIIIEYVYGTSAVDIPVANYYQSITRDGYKFKGWYNATSGGSKWLNIAQGKNQNLWAQWLEERIVTYYSIGQVYDTQTYGNGETLTLPTTAPTACDGYTFVGWTTAEQSETTTKPTLVSNTTVVSSDMILYAVYKRTEEGSGGGSTEVTDELSFANTNQRTSYSTSAQVWANAGITFTNNKASSTSNVGDYSNPVRLYKSSSIVIEHTSSSITQIEFDCNSSDYATKLKTSIGSVSGATVSMSSDILTVIFTSTVESFTISTLSEQIRLDALSVTYTTSNGTTTTYTTSPNCCPVNLEKPQVTYSVADGAVTLNWTMTNNAGDVADYTVACVGGETHTTTATSYTFTGLTNCAEYTFTVKANGDGTDVCSSALTTVTATPAAGSFVVTFDYGSGEGTPTQWTSGCSNGTSTTLPTPTTLPDNHTFVGWYDGTNIYEADETYTPVSNITLYARYQKEKSVDIVEWSPDAVTIEINTEGSAQVQIENEVEHGLGVGSAEGLFFSKYFEGSGSLKLLAIYNGTGKDIDLSTYRIDRGNNGDATNIKKTYDLSQLGTIKNGQEIIFYSWPASSEYSYSCSQSFLDDKISESGADDNPRWILCDAQAHDGIEFETMDFSGNDPLLLYKSSELIDVFGVSTEQDSPASTQICSGRSDEAWSADGVTNMDYGKTEADFEGGVVPEGVDLINPTITAYTARVIMFRKNTVVSGNDAVTKNKTDFVTFADEWEARQVCMSGDDGDLTCAAYQELGVFDYSVYYVSYDSLTRVDLGGNKNADGTYTIPVPQLDTLSCTKMRIQVLDNNGASLASSEYKVPIMVKSSGITTTDELFSKHGIEGCRDCDVVVLKNATLQKAPNGATNDMPEVRDMEVYAGGKLVVPNGTNYTMRKLVMRSKGDEVPVAEIDGTAVISDKLYHAKRIDAQKFYFFTLPYDCAVSDITYYNGEVLGARGIDYVIKYYDGAGRANGQNAGHWEEFTGATLQAGVGYILAVDASLNGDFNDNPKKEFLFPMTKTLTENSDKTVAVGTWGIGDATIGDNHKGWNLIGTPFMSHYNPISATGLKVGTYTDGEWNSEGTIFTYNESVTVPYVTMPNADGKTYTQRLASSQDLEPFKSFFIQVGKEGDVITDVAFSSAERLSKAPHRAPAVDATVWVELELKNTSGSDFTTIILDENCTADYEIGADLEKMLGYAALPQFYSLQSNARLAFNALPSEFASVSIPLGFYAPKSDTYTIALNTENTQNLEGVYLTDNVAGTVTNLLLDDYTFSSAKVLNETRFSIAVVRAVTAVDNVLAENDLVSIVNSYDLHIKNAPIGSELRVYDTLGREVISDQIDVEQKIYHLHTAGVYHVQIISKDKKSVYKVVSY